MMTARPDNTEAADSYFTYIDKVPPGDIRVTLAAQSGVVAKRLPTPGRFIGFWKAAEAIHRADFRPAFQMMELPVAF